MKLNLISIDKFLGKDLLNYHISNEQETLDRFQVQLNQYINTIQKRNENSASEGNQAGVFKDLLSDFYKYDVRIDHNKIDLSIWDSEHLKVIIEAKREANSPEMISDDNIDKKAFYEALFYYCEQSLNENQHLIKNIIITDFIKLYIFDSRQFLDLISVKKIKETFLEFQKDKDGFYKKMPLLSLSNTLEACKIDLFDENLDIKSLYKILDKHSLLGTPLENKDHNVLDKDFYNELLYIMGMEEKLEDNIPVIKPILIDNADNHSLHTMTQQKLQGINTKIAPEIWLNLADTEEDRYFTLALELILTWINRILFLKLLEAQLISYHPQEQKEHYKFLDSKKLSNWQEVSSLFFDILAKPLSERDKKEIPYLNSSLFERTAYENILGIDSFNPNDKLIPYEKTILKDKKPRPTLQYLLEFLDCYNFGMGDDNLSESKRLINASVLGLVFEKINGYKDGAVYTPSFITMSMSKEALRHTILQKFNDTYHWNCADFTALKNKIAKDDSLSLDELNKTFNSIRICDPAVGSGHFLVSVLNELLLIKYELKILCNAKGEILSHCDMNIAYDELFIKYNGKDFKYQVDNKNLPLSKEVQNLQETLFHEKETLIENCLFGVDINPKSAYICQLRLWIELLKNTYYIQGNSPLIQDLQTLPNIDINIKIGNSLVSRFPIKQDFSLIMNALKNKNITMDSYRTLVSQYKNAPNKDEKARIRQEIDYIKTTLRESFLTNEIEYDKLRQKHRKLIFDYEEVKRDLYNIDTEKLAKLENDIKKAKETLDKTDGFYHNSMEWRYEFPEVLDDNGNFLGFDLVIGNPPYIVMQKKILAQFWNWTADTYTMFIELAIQICRYQQGIISLIVPKFWLVNLDNYAMREYMLSNIDLISLSMSNPFKSVVTENTIMLFHNRLSTHNSINIYQDINETFKFTNIYQKEWAQTNLYKEILVNMTEEKIKLLKKIQKNTVMLSEISSSIRGAEIGKKECRETKSKDTLPILVGEDTSRYSIDYQNTSIPKGHKEYVRLEQWFKLDKLLLLRRVEPRLVANIIDRPYGFTKNLYGIKLFDESLLKFSYEFLLGIFNSSLLTYFYKIKFSTKKEESFPEIQKYLYEQLPIPQATAEQQAPIIDLVKQCMTAKANDKNADITALQSQIDNLVYSLYSLTDDEIRIIEGE